MSGWVRDEIRLGLPLRNYTLPMFAVNELGLSIDDFFQNMAKIEEPVAKLFTEVFGLPPGAILVGICRPPNMNALVFTYMHPDLPRVGDGLTIPMDDACLEDFTRWRQRKERAGSAL